MKNLYEEEFKKLILLAVKTVDRHSDDSNIIITPFAVELAKLGELNDYDFIDWVDLVF